MPRIRTGVAVCLVVVSALAAGCGDDAKESPPTATDRDTVGLPQYMRDTVACLREAGIKVRVPAAVRRLLKRREFQGQAPQGVEGGYLFFLAFDKDQKLTQAQILAARKCYEKR